MKDRRVALAVCLFALALAVNGCSGGVTGSPIGPPPPAPSPTASVTMCDPEACNAGTSFNIYNVKMVRITVNWSNLAAGEHFQSLRVFMPDGALYKKFDAGITVDSSGAGSWNGIFNIAGTNIWGQGLTGGWRVEAYLDEAAVPVSTVTLNLTE